MGPYVTMAEALLSLNAWVAAFSEALVRKVNAQGGEGGGSGGGSGAGEHAPKPDQDES